MPPNQVDFAQTIRVLASAEVWEYEGAASGSCGDVPQRTFESLQQPIDFPALEAAVVPGDRVVLAVDPNLPALTEVVHGVVKAVGQTEAGEIAIAVWDEATDETLAAIREEVGGEIQVVRHESSDRQSLRYVGADEVADPIYLNRLLVDADFVLPVVVGRPLDTCYSYDLTGIFPSFADSRSRIRHRQQGMPERKVPADAAYDSSESAWLLGVQLMVCVISNGRGEAARIVAGTPDAVGRQLNESRRLPIEFRRETVDADQLPPRAALVIASLDGDAQQQTWLNAARAIVAASRYVQPDGTILLWTGIDDPPGDRLLDLPHARSESDEEEDGGENEDEFPAWIQSAGPAQTFARISADCRLLIHSRLDVEAIESMGVGAIESVDELERLSRTFPSCGVLRAAQFAGTTIDHAAKNVF